MTTTRSMLTSFFKDKVQGATDIVEEVKKYVALEEKAGTWYGKCPFCKHENNTLTVSRADGGYFYCFNCYAGGIVFKFISLCDHTSYYDAIRKLAKQHGINEPEELKRLWNKSNEEEEES